MVNVLRTTSALAMVAASFGFADAGSFKCTGINYNIRAGPDWATAAEKCKPASQIASELALLKGVTDSIRLYSLTDCDQANAVVPAAIEAGLKIELGMWVDSSASSFETEKAAFQKLLETGIVTSDHIVGVMSWGRLRLRNRQQRTRKRTTWRSIRRARRRRTVRPNGRTWRRRSSSKDGRTNEL
ncbi:hypothetical protein DVH05_007608 [Phytophthora capsici]|nr:hypothetical protein DVH05_007608 [Phytophthora capsici]|eukprot:jgi/Phyca11/506998/fgenesh2_kg.PHYCAscaffold_23_\